MPWFLRHMTHVCLGGFMVIPLMLLFLLILPMVFGGVTVNDEYLTWQEYWKRGEPLKFLAWASFMLAIPFGVLNRKRWIRPYLIALPFVQTLAVEIILLVFDHPHLNAFNHSFTEPTNVFWGFVYVIAWVSIFIWYLYYKKIVVDYFNGEIEPQVSKNPG